MKRHDTRLSRREQPGDIEQYGRARGDIRHRPNRKAVMKAQTTANPNREKLLKLVEAVLTNDKTASNEELQQYFIRCGLTKEQSARAVAYRSHYFGKIVPDSRISL